MRARTALGIAVVVAACSGCAGRVVKATFEGTRFRMIVSAETYRPEGRLTEGGVQEEIDRLLKLRPASPVPANVLLYEIPSSRESCIRSARKALLLRRETAETMKAALEKTGLFAQIDFLPDLYLDDAVAGGLKPLRLAAARAHADALLLYSTEAGYEQRPNAWAALYVTGIGAFLAPGTDAAASAISHAVLVDVRTGYVYRVLQAYGESETRGSSAFIDDEELEFEARKLAIAQLATVTAEGVKRLAAERRRPPHDVAP